MTYNPKSAEYTSEEDYYRRRGGEPPVKRTRDLDFDDHDRGRAVYIKAPGQPGRLAKK